MGSSTEEISCCKRLCCKIFCCKTYPPNIPTNSHPKPDPSNAVSASGVEPSPKDSRSPLEQPSSKQVSHGPNLPDQGGAISLPKDETEQKLQEQRVKPSFEDSHFPLEKLPEGGANSHPNNKAVFPPKNPTISHSKADSSNPVSGTEKKLKEVDGNYDVSSSQNYSSSQQQIIQKPPLQENGDKQYPHKIDQQTSRVGGFHLSPCQEPEDTNNLQHKKKKMKPSYDSEVQKSEILLPDPSATPYDPPSLPQPPKKISGENKLVHAPSPPSSPPLQPLPCTNCHCTIL